MKGTIITTIALIVVALITVSVVTYAPQFIPTTMLGVIGTFAVAVAAVFAVISSISQTLDTIDRLREQRRQSLIARREAERSKSMPTPAQAAYNTYKAYQDLVLRSCDIVDLAGLPADDPSLAMQEFTIQQLYIPLRLLIDSPLTTGGEAAEVDVEATRTFQNDVEAGRVNERRQTSTFPQEEVSVGSLLNRHTHVVILGDPGSGKSTLVKWLALALMLREKNALSLDQFPDVAAIPQKDWVPILVRCRDIVEHRAVQVLDDLLVHSMRFRAIPTNEQEVLKGFLTGKVIERKALLIVDGLDEIRDTKTRTSFARRLQEITQQYAELPMVITSRIVGYREMRSRLGAQFHHATIADLKAAEKEKFAEIWCRATAPEIDHEQRTERLIAAINSNDDIRRITGSPLLLTILALVHRKLHKLPHRRAELYRCIMQVLLDFNPTIYDRIDSREAHPQLSYLAYAMEREGASQLDEDRILNLLTELRATYQTRSVSQRSPEEFLALIERQTSIIVQTGYVRRGGREVAVYEFKHETFKHYFAGLALIDNVYPNSVRADQLGDRIRPIFDKPEIVSHQLNDWTSLVEWAVEENWREILRLCVASAGLSDAENALDSMLNLPGASVSSDEKSLTARMGAVMAALCLADEPDVNVQAGERVMEKLFATMVHADALTSKPKTSFQEAILALLNAQDWHQLTDEKLLMSLETCPDYDASDFGSLYILSHPEHFPPMESISPEARAYLLEALRSGDKLSTIRACLTLVNALHQDSILEGIVVDTELTDALFQVMGRSDVERLVAVWALAWFWDRYYRKDLERSLSSEQMELLSTHLVRDSHPYVLHCISEVLGFSYAIGADFIYLWAVAADTGILHVSSMTPAQHSLNPELIAGMRQLLQHPAEKLRRGIAVSLARLGVYDEDSVNLLFDTMNSPMLSNRSRDEAVEELVRIGGERTIDRLITQLEVDDDYIQTRSMLALIGINSQEALSGLCNKLESNNPKTRYFAAAGLAVFVKNEDAMVVEALKRALARETEHEPKVEMERVLRLQIPI